MRPKRLSNKPTQQTPLPPSVGALKRSQAPTKPEFVKQTPAPTGQQNARVISSETYAPIASGQFQSIDDYVNKYLLDIQDLRNQINQQLAPGDRPNTEDLEKIIGLILDQADDTFLIGLAIIIFQMGIEAGKQDNVIKRIIFDLQGEDEWYDLGEWE